MTLTASSRRRRRDTPQPEERKPRHKSLQAAVGAQRAHYACVGSQAGIVGRIQIAGFIDGLFDKEEQLHLPEKAHRALLSLAEVHAMFAGAAQLLSDPTQPASEQSLAEFAHHAQKMTTSGRGRDQQSDPGMQTRAGPLSRTHGRDADRQTRLASGTG